MAAVVFCAEADAEITTRAAVARAWRGNGNGAKGFKVMLRMIKSRM
jgi:hypothetical protein